MCLFLIKSSIYIDCIIQEWQADKTASATQAIINNMAAEDRGIIIYP